MENGKIAAFGEIMMRLAASNGTIADSTSFDACYGGTEANILACLSQLGHKTEYLSALPDTELGRAVLAHLHGFGVGTDKVIVKGDTLGLYFSETGKGSRGANVIYYRKNSEIAKLDENAYDLDTVFDGVSLFHISGISFALSDGSRRLAFALVDAAKKRGVPVSFDFNYRSRLWSIETAKPILKAAAEKADIILAATIDLNTFLNTTEDEFFNNYGAKYLIVRDRKVIDEKTHSVRIAVHRRDGGKYETPTFNFNVTERVGGGDAFDGGVLHSILKGDDIAAAAKFGAAAFVLKHSIAGDTFVGIEADVIKMRDKLFAKGE